MSSVILAVALGLVALLVVGIVLQRGSTRRKKEAVESLAAERAALASPSILDLVNEEVEDLGLRSIPGAQDVAPDGLLRAWKDADASLKEMDHAQLRFVVQPGADTDDPEHEAIRLEAADGPEGEPSGVGSDAAEPEDSNDA